MENGIASQSLFHFFLSSLVVVACLLPTSLDRLPPEARAAQRRLVAALNVLKARAAGRRVRLAVLDEDLVFFILLIL